MAMAQARLSTANRRREMECAVCLDRLRHPKTLPCQHNFCGDCLEGLVQDEKISCPTCRKETTLGPGGVGDLPKNIALISIMASFCEQCLCRDREVCCDHCGLWMCSQCHESCESEQDITKQCKALMKDLSEEELEIVVQRSKLTKTVESIMDQIDATEGRMIKNIRLSAKRLRDETTKELNKQFDLWDKLTTAINQLKTEISEFTTNCLKTRETSEIDVESLTGQWSGQLSSCQSEIAQANRLIEFITWETSLSLGEITVKPKNNEHAVSTIPEQRDIQNAVIIDYKHAQFEYSMFGQFVTPTRVAISPVTKNFVILDRDNNRIQFLNPHYKLVSEFGSKGRRQGWFDFGSYMGGLCVTDDGLIVVSDSNNHRLQLFNEHGYHVRSIGSKGTGSGQFKVPQGLVIYKRFIYMCDSGNYRIQVFDVCGKFVRQFGSKDVFNNKHPVDITIHKNEDIYVVAYTKLFVFNAEGEYKGAVNTDSVILEKAWGVTTDSIGHIILSDSSTHNIHILTAEGTLIKTLGSEGHRAGQLYRPVGLVCSQDGRIFVADWFNSRIQVFSVKPSLK